MDKARFNIWLRYFLLVGFLGLVAILLAMGAEENNSHAAPLDCLPPPTSEPLWVDPVTSPTTLFTETLRVALGRGRAITVASEAGTVAVTGTFDAYTPASVTVPLLPRTTHHLGVSGLVEYETGCFYTLSTNSDRNSHPLTIVQVSPTIYLPLVMRNFGGPTLAGCPMFPTDNPWNRDISNDPVDSNSDNYIASINQGATYLHADFGSNLDYGIPYTIVPGTQPMVPITFDEYGDESDPGPYPIPPNAPVEAGSDHHVLVLNSGTCKLYELYHASKDPSGPGWTAGSGAVFTMTSNALRPEGWTSADAAGLPILPGLVRYDEAASGSIKHAVRFTVWRSQKAYIHPATHYASSYTDSNLPPMGLRLRLKASYDISGFTGQARVILEALKRYGMIVADNGTSWYITGATDSRWDDDDLDQLKTVPGSAFEVVQSGTIIKP
jgi:hypothetical protein